MNKKITLKWSTNLNEFVIDKVNSINVDPKVKRAILRWHYLKSSPRGCSHYYVLKHNDIVFGVAAFGYPTGKNSPGDVECKRFVLVLNAPKNMASWFMSKCLKRLANETQYQLVVSYADTERHEGTLYKASNFIHLGESYTKQMIVDVKTKKKYHLRIAYQKFNGKYTKTALKVQQKLKNGEAKYISLAKKNIFVYDLKR